MAQVQVRDPDGRPVPRINLRIAEGHKPSEEAIFDYDTDQSGNKGWPIPFWPRADYSLYVNAGAPGNPPHPGFEALSVFVVAADFEHDIAVVLPRRPFDLARLVVRGNFFARETGDPWTMIQCSDFNLLARFVAGEDITPILQQRQDVGFNTLRVWTAYDIPGIGRLRPEFATYDAIPGFLALCAQHGLYVELTAFTGPYAGVFADAAAMVCHWDTLCDAVEGEGNAFLERVNEGDNGPNQGVPPDLARPFNGLASNGSNSADADTVTPIWGYGSYHTNDLPEWQRKVGHNAMELADLHHVPITANENTRFPDKDGSREHAYDAARAAALLCAGACFHSVRGKSSERWDGLELACAEQWVRGAQSVPLEFQQGAYHHRTDLEGPGVIRVYDRTLPDGRSCIVAIRA